MAITHAFSQTIADGADATLVRPSDWNSNHVEIRTFSGNTSGNSTISGLNIIWAGGTNITLSADTANSKVSIIGAAGVEGISALGNTLGTNTFQPDASGTVYFSGGNNVTLSGTGSTIVFYNPLYTQYMPYPIASTASQSLGVMGTTSASQYFFPMSIENGVVFDEVRILASCSMVSSSISGRNTINFQYGIYSKNASSLSSISSGSFSMAITQSSGSGTISYPSSTNSAGYTYGTTSWSATAQGQSLVGTVGNRIFGLNFGNTMSLSGGQYWLGLLKTESTTSAAIGISMGVVGNANNAIASAVPMGQSTANWSSGTNNAGVNWFRQGHGVHSAGTGALLASVALTDMLQTISVYPLVTFIST